MAVLVGGDQMSFVGYLFQECHLCLLWCHLTCFVSFFLSWLNNNFLFASILSKQEILLLHSQDWRSYISRRILFLTVLTVFRFAFKPDKSLCQTTGCWCWSVRADDVWQSVTCTERNYPLHSLCIYSLYLWVITYFPGQGLDCQRKE